MVERQRNERVQPDLLRDEQARTLDVERTDWPLQVGSFEYPLASMVT